MKSFTSLARQLSVLLLSLTLLTSLHIWSVYSADRSAKEPAPRAPHASQPRTRTASTPNPKTTSSADTEKASERYGQLPLSFQLNEGQTNKAVRYLARGSGYNLFLTSTEAVLALRRSSNSQASVINAPGIAASRNASRSPSATTTAVLRLQLKGANPTPRIEAQEQLAGTNNYFIGRDPRSWRTNIATYAKVKYSAVYAGVDLMYYGNQRQLEYDFVVAPGADASVIRLAIRGAQQVRIDESGDLLLRTSAGEVRQHKPLAYQETSGGGRQQVASHYVMRGRNEIGFAVGPYDNGRPLIIDPVLSYSTFLGGTGHDSGRAIAVDADGNAYVTGEAVSANFPVTSGAYRTVKDPYPSGGDAYVTKLNATGTGFVYSTYLGGESQQGFNADYDGGFGIAVDAQGNAYVTGITTSPYYPTTPGAFQSYSNQFHWGNKVFVTKLNATGSALVYSTYLGGNGADIGNGIAVDAGGNAYVTGESSSTNFPTTPGAYLTTLSNGYDGFVTKLNATGTALAYSTFMGGAQGKGIALDAAGQAYVVGDTGSDTFPVVGGFQDYYASSGAYYSWMQGDACLEKFDVTGSSLLYSTYAGSNAEDHGRGVAVDASGHAFLTGWALSYDFPHTAGAFQTTPGYGATTFVTKIDTTATGQASLVYSTFIGSSGGTSFGAAVAVDAEGNAYVSGATYSNNFPVTPCAFGQSSKGDADGFLSKLDAAGANLLYSTYLASSGTDSANGVAIGPDNSVYVTGAAGAGDFPTLNAVQSQYGGGSFDAYVAKFDATDDATDLSITKTASASEVESNAELTYTLTVINNSTVQAANVIVTDQLPSGTTFSSANTTQGTLATPSVGADGTVSATLGDLAAHATATITLVLNVSAAPCSIIQNTATVTSDTCDSKPQNNSASLTTSVVGAHTDLSITKTGEAETAASGSSFTYNITVHNSGPDAAINVIVTDELLEGNTFLSATTGQGSLTVAPPVGSSGNVQWSLGDIAANTTVALQLTVNVSALPGTVLLNTATVSSHAACEPDLLNNSATTGITVVEPTNTSVGEGVSVQIGDTVITFANVTAAGLTTVTPIDPASVGLMPGGYTLTDGSLAFEIKTTAQYSGPIQICFRPFGVNDSVAFDELRILHGEDGVLVDRTILAPDAPAPDFNTRTIYARVYSLSPFVIARAHPLYGVRALFDQTKANKSGSTIPIKLQLTSPSGAGNLSSKTITVTALNIVRLSNNASGTLNDAGNANPDYDFRYDSGVSGGGYIFNLKTTGYATGTYLMRFKAGNDPIIHTVQFQVR
jgi:uncharacterized repeat protein (TIGR01451 family)